MATHLPISSIVTSHTLITRTGTTHITAINTNIPVNSPTTNGPSTGFVNPTIGRGNDGILGLFIDGQANE